MDKFIKAWRKSSDLKVNQADVPVATHSKISNNNQFPPVSDNNYAAIDQADEPVTTHSKISNLPTPENDVNNAAIATGMNSFN